MPSLVNAVQNQARATLDQTAERALTVTKSSTPVDISDFEGQLCVTEVLVAATGAQTTVATIESSNDVSFGGGANPTVLHATFATFTQSDLKRVAYKLIDSNACQRYLRVTNTMAGSSPVMSSCYVLTGCKQVQ